MTVLSSLSFQEKRYGVYGVTALNISFGQGQVGGQGVQWTLGLSAIRERALELPY